MAVTCLLLESSTTTNNHNQFDPMMPMCLYPPGEERRVGEEVKGRLRKVMGLSGDHPVGVGVTQGRIL